MTDDAPQLLSGPWDTEPNEKKWMDPATGLPCMILRHANIGHLCGYVGVTKLSKFYLWDYQKLPGEVLVHGGLTFSNFWPAHTSPAKSIWWFGFDCAHAGDFCPTLAEKLGTIGHQHTFKRWKSGYEVYRDLDFVTNECTKLALQLHDFEHQL